MEENPKIRYALVDSGDERIGYQHGTLRMKYAFNKEEHIHTLDGKPLMGTSTVMGIVAKPLTWWASGKAVEVLGWRHPKKTDPKEIKTAATIGLRTVKGMTVEQYVSLLNTAYRAHNDSKNDSAVAGTDMHAEAEKWVKAVMEGREIVPHEKIWPFTGWARENVKDFLWSEMHTFSESLWVGGITDCGAILKDGRTVIIDFKSSKEAYQSQFWQIGGYDLQVSENGGFDGEGNRVLYPMKIHGHIVFAFGADNPEPSFVYDTESDRDAFKSALELYKKSQLFAK